MSDQHEQNIGLRILLEQQIAYIRELMENDHHHSQELLEQQIKHNQALVELDRQRTADQLKLQADIYAAHFGELNNHSKQMADAHNKALELAAKTQAMYLPRDLYESHLESQRVWQIDVSEKLSVSHGKNSIVMILVGAGVTLMITMFIMLLTGKLW
jgi:hypothetical protein